MSEIRLIDANALKEAIENYLEKRQDVIIWETDMLNMLDNAPTVDFEKLGASLRCQIRAEYGSCDDCELSCPRNELIKLLDLERSHSKWIPTSERLPDNREWYLGLFKESDTDFIGIPYICDYVGKITKGTTNEGWILRHCTDVDNASDYFRNLICVAWQPLPEPYKEEGMEE